MLNITTAGNAHARHGARFCRAGGPGLTRAWQALAATGLALACALPAAAVLPAGVAQEGVQSRERNELATRLPLNAGVSQHFDPSRVAVHSSAIRPKAGGTAVTVTSANDPVDPFYGNPLYTTGTLRWAINFVNSNCFYGPYTIDFAIPEPVTAIAVAAGYPMDTITCNGTLVDGFSQAGSSPNSLTTGSNAVIKIALDGSAQGSGSGLAISADGVEVRGLAIYKMPSHGIEVNTCGASTGLVIQGNFLGTNPAGANGLGNGGYGIISAGNVECVGMQGMQIGGTAYSARNTIVSNVNGGIYLSYGGATTPNAILRNDVGVSPSGSGMGNIGPGLTLDSESGTIIGSMTDPADSNQFFANSGEGVKIIPVFLPAAAAKAAVTTGGHQFGINYTANNSAGIGFDIGGDGPDANDTGDALLPQNFPDLGTITFDTATSSMRVQGNLDSANTGPFRVLLFGHQFATNYEAGNYLGQFTVSAGGAFDQTVSVTQASTFYGGITTNATSTVAGSQSSEISGATTLPVVSQDLTSIDFGGVAVGTSSSRTVTVSSATGLTLLSSSTPPTGYTVDTSTCASVADPATTCTISVTFAPGAAGSSSGNLDFVSNSAGLQRISLAAVGMSPPTVAVGFSPTSVLAGGSATLTITLSNPNSLDITGASFTNTYPAGLVHTATPAEATTCGGSVTATGGGNSLALTGGTIPAGGSCTVTASVTSASPGSYTNAIAAGAVSTTNAGSNAAGASATLTVTQPAATLSPTSITFAAQRVGTPSLAEVLTLSNPGTAPLAITSILASGDFAQTNDCGSSLATGTSCTISVSFTPTATGARTGAITVTDNAPGSPHSASLNGTGVEPVFGIAPSSLTFGAQRVATTSAAQVLTLSNSGTGPLFLSGIVASGDFAQTNSCGTSVAAGGSCTISVTFTPTATGARTGTITISDDAPGGPHIVGVSGTGTEPAATVSPTSLTFGAQRVGTSSTAQTVTLSNTGTAPLAISGITATGDFAQTNNCGISVAAAGSCTISVTFTPTASGPRTGSVTITDDAAGSPRAVTLTGTGAVQPVAVNWSFTPSTVFANSASKLALSITNPNGAPFSSSFFSQALPAGLAITSVPVAPPGPCAGTIDITVGGPVAGFQVTGLSVPTTGSCTFEMDVGSGTLGTYAISMPAGAIVGSVLSETNVTNAASNTASLVVSAVPVPVLTLDPPAPGPLDFGPITLGSVSSPLDVKVSNTGTATLTFSAPVSITGDFQKRSTTCGATLPAPPDPLSACTETVVFQPTALGVRTGTFTVASDGGNATLNLAGEGKPVPVPVISVSVGTLNFPSQIVNTTSPAQSITVTNAGTAPLAISGITVSGDFAVSSGCTAASPLAPSAACTVDVTFKPILTGTRTGQVTIASNDPASPTTPVSLTGQGVPPAPPIASLSPGALDFPATTALQVSAPLVSTLTNTGGTPLAIVAVEVVGSGFRVSNDCGTSVASLASCRITAQFAPPVEGNYLADVRIVTNAAGSPTLLRLSGTGIPAPKGRLTATPAALNFGDLVVGEASGAQSFTVANAGDATVSISGITVTGDFALAGSCSDLRPGASCLLQVTFTPTEEGPRGGQAIIASNASNPTLGVALAGVGTPLPVPRLQLSSSGLGYGNTLIGSPGSQSVTVTNTGGANLELGPIVATGDFRVSGNCSGALAPRQSCRLDVDFVPTIPGQRGGEVSIASNAPSSPDRVNLSGVGCRFALTGRSFALICSP